LGASRDAARAGYIASWLLNLRNADWFGAGVDKQRIDIASYCTVLPLSLGYPIRPPSVDRSAHRS